MTDTIGYQEDDKLGVLGTTTTPTLRDKAQLRVALLEEFRAAVAGARAAVEAVQTDTPTAVHASRKALRRARALVAMIATELPRSERRAVRDALRESRRGLSASRDHAVAPGTLAALTLGDEDRAVAHQILANATAAMPPIAEIRQLLEAGAARAAAQLDALSASLPAAIKWSTVRDGVRAAYAEARANRRASKNSTLAFHAWRRRSKELVYQLDFVARHAGMRVDQLRAELDGVTDTASSAADLIMLREFVETYAQGVPAAALENLVAAIDAQIGDLRKAARKAGREAFADRPKRFAKRIARAVKKDLAPPEPAKDADTHAAADARPDDDGVAVADPKS
ncbi:MAG: CHAD domain-containing protein [Proteobacteria bacterium]|nr:CHAD domain-containing protein [Pseudomonadota bacterium]